MNANVCGHHCVFCSPNLVVFIYSIIVHSALSATYVYIQYVILPCLPLFVSPSHQLSYCPHGLLPAVCKRDYWHKHIAKAHPHITTLHIPTCATQVPTFSYCLPILHPQFMTASTLGSSPPCFSNYFSPTTLPILTHCCLTYSLVLGLRGGGVLSSPSGTLKEFCFFFRFLLLVLSPWQLTGKRVIHHGYSMRDHPRKVAHLWDVRPKELMKWRLDRQWNGLPLHWRLLSRRALIHLASYLKYFNEIAYKTLRAQTANTPVSTDPWHQLHRPWITLRVSSI